MVFAFITFSLSFHFVALVMTLSHIPNTFHKNMHHKFSLNCFCNVLLHKQINNFFFHTNLTRSIMHQLTKLQVLHFFYSMLLKQDNSL
jgi:hypothetical protein